MIISSDLYRDSEVSPIKTMDEVDKLLKKFGIVEQRFTKLGPDNSYLEFLIKSENKPPLKIKIWVPFIEKAKGSKWNKTFEYDEIRSYRFFFHYLKALLSAKDANIAAVEEIFMAHITIPLPGGGETTLGQQMQKQLQEGIAPQLEGFEVKPIPTGNALPDKSDKELKLTKRTES